MTDAHMMQSQREWDKRCEAEDIRAEQIKEQTKGIIRDNYLGVDILTESGIQDDENWQAFLDVVVKHAEKKLNIHDKVLMMDKILDNAVNYATEIAEREE